MARSPQPGQTKTRLEPLLGPDGCCRLQTELIRHTAAWVTDATSSAWLAYCPDDAASEIGELVPEAVRLFAQEGEDLGVRMRRATECVSRSSQGPLAVIGTDCPEMGPVHLGFVARALIGPHDVALIPALDGGYALIALKRPTPAAFSLPAEAWGGPDVLELTIRELQRNGCSVAVLEPVRDLDTPEDAAFVAADPRCPEPIRQLLRGVEGPV